MWSVIAGPSSRPGSVPATCPVCGCTEVVRPSPFPVRDPAELRCSDTLADISLGEVQRLCVLAPRHDGKHSDGTRSWASLPPRRPDVAP